MTRLPLPPARAVLQGIGPTWFEVPAGSLFWRVYFRGGPFPSTWRSFRAFGPTDSRFDHHTIPRRTQSRHIFYAAEHGHTCIAEFLQLSSIIDTETHVPWLVAFRLESTVKLIDLTGTWPTMAGASMAINSGGHPKARAWSRAIYEAFPDAHGLYYCSAMNGNKPCIALYERAESAMPELPAFHTALADPRVLPLLARCVAQFNYSLILPPSH